MIRIKKILAVAAACSLMFTGCTKLPAQVAEIEEQELQKEYNANEMYLILASRKNEVRDVYTDEIFNVKLDDHGKLYDDAFNEMVRNYITQMYMMTRMCEERGIEVNTTDLREIEERAEKYLSDYKTSGCACEITKEDVTQILMDEYLIDRLKETIIEEADVEVSESDARVMDIIRITLDDAESANETLNEVSQEGADFDAAARRHSTDANIDLKVGRGDLEPSAEEIVFNLEDGEISPIIQLNGKYYIYKCVSGYDEEATAVVREKMTRQREKECIAHEYDLYIQEHEYELDDNEWANAVKLCRDNNQCPDIFEY